MPFKPSKSIETFPLFHTGWSGKDIYERLHVRSSMWIREMHGGHSMDTDVQLLSLAEVARRLSIGRSYLYAKLIAPGVILTVRLGRAVRVPRIAVDASVAG